MKIKEIIKNKIGGVDTDTLLKLVLVFGILIVLIFLAWMVMKKANLGLVNVFGK